MQLVKIACDIMIVLFEANNMFCILLKIQKKKKNNKAFFIRMFFSKSNFIFKTLGTNNNLTFSALKVYKYILEFIPYSLIYVC